MPQLADQQDMEMLRQQMSGSMTAPGSLTVRFSMVGEEITDEDSKPEDKKGLPCFIDREFITIWVPGDKDNVVHRPVRPGDKVRFSQQYQAFKANAAQPMEGTPLDRLPFLSAAQVLEFAHYGVRTAEQIMSMSDSHGQKVTGFHQIKARVKTFIDAAEGAAPALKLQAELEKRDSEIEVLKNMLDEQRKRLDIMAAKKG